MNVRNRLALLIGSNVFDLVADIHMPVNSLGGSGRGIAAPSLDDHPNLAQRVLLVVSIVREDLQLSAVEFLRPVALFAGLLRRAQVLHRSRNRPGKSMEHG